MHSPFILRKILNPDTQVFGVISVVTSAIISTTFFNLKMLGAVGENSGCV